MLGWEESRQSRPPNSCKFLLFGLSREGFGFLMISEETSGYSFSDRAITDSPPGVQHLKRWFPSRRCLPSIAPYPDASTRLRDNVEHHRVQRQVPVAHRWLAALRLEHG